MSLATWLASDRPRTLLAALNFARESGGAPAEGTLYFSKKGGQQPIVTEAGDTPGDVAYRDAIRVAPTLVRAAPTDTLGGSTRVEIGELVLDNPDGALDFMLRLAVYGRAAELDLGDHEWARADYERVATPIIEGVEAKGDDAIVVILRDQRRLLNKDIAGEAVNDERRKPIVLCAAGGIACSIEPVEKSAANLQYWCVENFAGALLSQVYDNGVPLRVATALHVTDNTTLTANTGTDVLNLAAHGLAVNDVLVFQNVTNGVSFFTGLSLNTQYWVIASGLGAADFKLSLTKGGAAEDVSGSAFVGVVTINRHRAYDNLSNDGSIELSGSPAGRVTVDLQAKSPSQSSINDGLGSALKAILIDYGGIDGADIDSASFTAIDGVAIAGEQAAARVVLDRENLLTVLDDLARVLQVFYGPDHEGVFRAGRFDLSALSGASSTRSLDYEGCLSEPLVRNANVITGTVAIRSRKNCRPLTYGELAASVSVADKRILSGEYREMAESTAPSGTTYAGNWQAYYRTPVRAEISGAFAASGADVINLADDILDDLKPHVKLIDVETDLTAYDWNLGDVVTFTYPRYGFDAGHKCAVARIAADFDQERVGLTLITRVEPDTTTASFP